MDEAQYGFDRTAKAIECPACHGYAERVPVTESEEAKYGCGRIRCCARAFVCKRCQKRIAGIAEAPEMA